MNNDQTKPKALPMTAQWLKDKLHDLHTKGTDAINEVVNEIKGHCDNPRHFTIEEFNKFLATQDQQLPLANILPNCTAENIVKANEPASHAEVTT